MITYYKGLVTPFTTVADVIHPTRAHDTDVGWDLYTPRDLDEGGFAPVLMPQHRVILPLGIQVALPENHFALLCPRSGLAASRGIGFVNGFGVIDNGYHGELNAIVYNYSQTPFTFESDARIAQLLILPMSHVTMKAVSHSTFAVFAQSDRGEGGLGSTGT